LFAPRGSKLLSDSGSIKMAIDTVRPWRQDGGMTPWQIKA
jgi:hypothetical protein